MEGVLKDALTSQPILQVFAGAVALIVVAYMVMRGAKDRESAPSGPSLPAPAPGGITEVQAIFTQGPRELLDTFRQMREDVKTIAENSYLVKEMRDDLDKIRDDVRSIKDDGHQRTEILRSIEKEQEVANRSKHPGRNP